MNILGLIEKNGIKLDETPVSEEELKQAEEIFISSTTAEIIPVVTLDGQSVGSGKPGPVTKQLQAAFQESIQLDEIKISSACFNSSSLTGVSSSLIPFFSISPKIFIRVIPLRMSRLAGCVRTVPLITA